MELPDMLNKNKKLTFIVILIFFYILGCKENLGSRINNNLDYKEMRNDFLAFSQNHMGNEKFKQINISLNDSLINWKKNNLSNYNKLNIYDWALDSILCINKNRDKLISALILRDAIHNDATLDYLVYLYGVKINTLWYFFEGATIVIPQEKLHTPRNFQQLHQIAMKEVFSGYLKKTWNGKWEINEAFFDRIEFQFEKWAYWDSNGKEIINSKLSSDSLQKLYLDRIIYDKYRFQ